MKISRWSTQQHLAAAVPRVAGRRMGMRGVRRWICEPRGAALLTVLLSTVLMFILVSAMLITAGKEIFIAGLHRDAVSAEEYAQAGVEDVLRRMEAGRPWKPGAVAAADRCDQEGSPGIRMSLPGAAVCVAVTPRLAGPGGSVMEIRANGSSGRARRRMAAAVLARTATALPGVIAVRSHSEDPGVEIAGGVVHAQTFVRYLAGVSSGRTTYAGWRIELTAQPPGSGLGPCYTHADCAAAGRPQWWPGHRRAGYAAMMLRPDPLPGNLVPDRRRLDGVLDYSCPAGPPPAQAVQTIGTDGPGFQVGDRRADLDPGDPLQSAVGAEPLYGCAVDGLAYTWLRDTADLDEDGEPDQFLWFRILRFDQWAARYVCFDEGALSWGPCNGFHFDPAQGDPRLGAVLPLIPGPVWAQNYDQSRTGGGSLTPGEIDLGRCADPPLCRSSASRRTIIALRSGSYALVCPGSCPDGHGVLVVDGDLTLAGSFTYRGTIVVGGVLTAGSGAAVVIHGVVSAGRIAGAGGALRLFSGTPIAVGAAGPLAVSRRAWWER